VDDQAARDSSKTPRHRIHPRTLANARQLRTEIVNAELKLWKRLRNRELDGLKFRRQTPIGTYIVDFICHETKLVLRSTARRTTSERITTRNGPRSLSPMASEWSAS
jgi:hypothetical protein